VSHPAIVHTELLLLALVVGALAVTWVCRRLDVPAPLVLVVVGIAASFIPGVETVQFDPNIVLFVVLTPLLYSSALESSFLGIRQNLRPIGLLAVGLPVFTAVAVGLVAWQVVPGLSLAAALVLGAVVAPPDAVSALSIGRRLGLPRRLMTIVGGESLVNDATALTLFRVFVVVAAGGGISILEGFGIFLLAAVGGTAIVLAARKVREKASKLAAHLLEAAPEDIVFDHGNFYVAGSPAKSQTIQNIALMANLAWNLPEGMQPGLEESHFYDPANFTFPFGAHICTVEVDADTGQVKILRYIAVDDIGYVINPLIVEGQVHGGVAQGIGQALYEAAIYDDGGQLLSGSMMDYTVPSARQVPFIETARTETPSPTNPMGVKGVGETGTIASTQAVVNAVVDALSPLGVRHVEMPMTPERVWRTIQAARQGGQQSGAANGAAGTGAGMGGQ
jgi:hypothetical protein